MINLKKGRLLRSKRPLVFSGIVAFGIVLVLAVSVVIARVALSLSAPQQIATYDETRAQIESSYIEVLDRKGELLDKIRQDFAKRQGEWLPLDEISPSFITAILHSEDKRFYKHSGVDWLALLNATQIHLQQKIRGFLKSSQTVSTSRGGASGISMQLASMLRPELQAKRSRSYLQKWHQLATALALENTWTKDEILEVYLNLLPFRGEMVGISAAAESFYGKYAFALNSRESAVLAAMVRAPNTSIEQLTKRSCDLLQKMHNDEQCAGLESFIAYFLGLPNPEVLDRYHSAPHIAQYARRWASLHHKKTVRTTLDAELQEMTRSSIQHHLSELYDEAVQDAAVVVLNNDSGEILAYIGSSDTLSAASEVDHVRARRQVASTLKPFLYAQAIDEKRLTAASLLNDSPINLMAGEGLYIPQNHDRNFAGWVSLRVALASSLNIPAVRTIVSMGVDSFYKTLKALHLPLDRDSDFYGFSLALGAADMDLLSLTNAYRALANSGNYSAVTWNKEEPEIVQKNEVFSPEATWIISDILSDRQARAYTFGLDSVLTTPFWSAVKTGTSKDMRDNWTVGWSAKYTVGVWVGNSDGRSMQNISGVSGAGPIWHDVMRYLHRQEKSKAPVMPENIVAETVSFVGVNEAARQEYFLSGTEMQQIVALTAEQSMENVRIRIQSPINGTILALDPDIPSHVQKLHIKANISTNDPRAESLRWYIANAEVGRGVSNFWSPNRGAYRIVLKDENAKVLDEVFISVR